jgi:hypothetical protein
VLSSCPNKDDEIVSVIALPPARDGGVALCPLTELAGGQCWADVPNTVQKRGAGPITQHIAAAVG